MGKVTERLLVSGDRKDSRYGQFPFSDTLRHYRIAHAGVLTTGHPYELTRVHQDGSCMVASLSGEGRVFVDGKWITLPEGYACLLPPFAFNSIRSVEGKDWTFVWVKYLEDEGIHPVVTALSPVYGSFDAQPLQHAVRGLHEQMRADSDKGAETLWVELIHKYS